jgi:polyphosphate kinase 2 (PPK2 family)
VKTPRLEDTDLSAEIEDKKEYEEQLEAVQLRLLRQQQACYQDGRRVIVAMEGWDASGKGGAIKRVTEQMDPRGYRVWPISAPRDDEQGRHYLYRFWTKLPPPGGWAIFDRTWYGRVLVERIEKLCKKSAWKRAYGEINAFEKMLVDDGVVLVKIFLHLSKKEQLRRFKEREENPYKKWKIGDDDWRNRKKWSQYEEAIEQLLGETSTKEAPWTIVAGEHKWWARVKVCETIAGAVEAAS